MIVILVSTDTVDKVEKLKCWDIKNTSKQPRCFWIEAVVIRYRKENSSCSSILQQACQTERLLMVA
jgi:hypothetical protein